LSRILLLTGKPGIGKTTIIQRTVVELVSKGLKVGGMITQEIREKGTRIGFKIKDISNKREGWLAHINHPNGPRIGKYKVNLRDLEEVGARAIHDAAAQADVIVIDEIGPMELFSQPFKNAVIEAIRSNKPILGTIHYRVKGQFIESIRRRSDVEVIEVTFGNRNGLPRVITEKIIDAARKLSKTFG